jgi:hypothetical protein
MSFCVGSGVKAIVLTMGAQGAALVQRAAGSGGGGSSLALEALHVPALPCSVVSLSGAGGLPWSDRSCLLLPVLHAGPRSFWPNTGVRSADSGLDQHRDGSSGIGMQAGCRRTRSVVVDAVD